ncbi:hypothetical protein RUM43_008113 [Polyplax serrata]|uniref:Secreted protein n=1 Tax=Polyplax serrata TaxID=468196 RepID=A0AAN8Q6T2_POLSC
MFWCSQIALIFILADPLPLSSANCYSCRSPDFICSMGRCLLPHVPVHITLAEEPIVFAPLLVVPYTSLPFTPLVLFQFPLSTKGTRSVELKSNKMMKKTVDGNQRCGNTTVLVRGSETGNHLGS